jgi:hypothetical protein
MLGLLVGVLVIRLDACSVVQVKEGAGHAAANREGPGRAAVSGGTTKLSLARNNIIHNLYSKSCRQNPGRNKLLVGTRRGNKS